MLVGGDENGAIGKRGLGQNIRVVDLLFRDELVATQLGSHGPDDTVANGDEIQGSEFPDMNQLLQRRGCKGAVAC